MVRTPAPVDVFNAIAEARRREILDVLVEGEMPVGDIVDQIGISQPQVSKHLRVLNQAGLVQCRAAGRQRLYRLNPGRLRPLHDWAAKYELLLNERFDRLDSYLTNLQHNDSTNEQKGAS
jgi:DNA-binding transcriptional ArsR family regulator